MARARGQSRDGDDDAPAGRWQRRAARHEAERRRMPKHGKGYVTLAQQLIARRAAAAAGKGRRRPDEDGSSR
jgi:hypothetical protein